MRCLLCKSGEMKKSVDSYFAKTKNGYIIIENTPCLRCDECGEVVYPLSVLEIIDGIVVKFDEFKSKISVVDYCIAA